jgi:Spy/CpxP family protein refolding chaperone
MNFRHIIMAAASSCALAATGALAHPGGDFHGGEGMEILHSLNLTDAQKDQAHQIEHAAWAQARPVMEQMHAVHEQLATAMLAPGAVTADTLAPMVTQEQQLRAQLDSMRLNTALQIRALLTPEQLTEAAVTHQKLAALHEQEHAVMHASETSAP